MIFFILFCHQSCGTEHRIVLYLIYLLVEKSWHLNDYWKWHCGTIIEKDWICWRKNWKYFLICVSYWNLTCDAINSLPNQHTIYNIGVCFFLSSRDIPSYLWVYSNITFSYLACCVIKSLHNQHTVAPRLIRPPILKEIVVLWEGGRSWRDSLVLVYCLNVSEVWLDVRETILPFKLSVFIINEHPWKLLEITSDITCSLLMICILK